MACNDIRKYTSGEMHGMMTNHLNLELRGEKFHANKEIDNSKSDMNYYLKVSSGDELRTNFDKRIEEVDAKHPPKRMKKDRKTGLSICCYVPKEISGMGDEAEKEFLEKTIGYYETVFGKDNVIGMSVHKDEIHSYIDKSTKEMTESLVHGHLVVVPYAKWKDKSGEREGINASHCIDRQRLIDLNKDYNEFVKKEFGIDFNRGNGIHNGESVEELKEASKEQLRDHQNKINELKAYEDIEEDNLKLTREAVQNEETILKDLKKDVQRLKDEQHEQRLIKSRADAYEAVEQFAKESQDALQNSRSLPNKLSNKKVEVPQNIYQGIINSQNDFRQKVNNIDLLDYEPDGLKKENIALKQENVNLENKLQETIQQIALQQKENNELKSKLETAYDEKFDFFEQKEMATHTLETICAVENIDPMEVLNSTKGIEVFSKVSGKNKSDVQQGLEEIERWLHNMTKIYDVFNNLAEFLKTLSKDKKIFDYEDLER